MLHGYEYLQSTKEQLLSNCSVQQSGFAQLQIQIPLVQVERFC